MSDTPITDAARLKLDSDDSSCAIYAHTLDGSSHHGEVVRGDEMAILERENAAMREAIRVACGALSTLSDWRRVCDAYDDDMGHPQRDYDEEQVEMMEQTAQRPLSRIQPFLKP